MPHIEDQLAPNTFGMDSRGGIWYRTGNILQNICKGGSVGVDDIAVVGRLTPLFV